MSVEKELFNRWKEILVRRYGEGFGEGFVQEAHENLMSTYRMFAGSDCADPHFIDEVCSSDLNKSAQRLGEVLLYERLLHLGLEPTSKPKGPDFRVEINGRPVWLELVTPGVGDDNRISDLFSAHNSLYPCAEQAIELRQRSLLRVSNAISGKLAKYEDYLRDGVVPPEEPLIIVVNDALLCPDSFFYGISHNADHGVGGVSLAEHAVNSIGQSIWVAGEEPGRYAIERTYRDMVDNRPEPKKDGGVRGTVPVSLFANPTEPHAKAAAERATIISAVLQITLREDYGVLMQLRAKAETEERLMETIISRGTFVNNPRANNPVGVDVSTLLTTVVVAPTLSPRDLWDLETRRLKLFLGDVFQEKPFPS